MVAVRSACKYCIVYLTSIICFTNYRNERFYRNTETKEELNSPPCGCESIVCVMGGGGLVTVHACRTSSGIFVCWGGL